VRNIRANVSASDGTVLASTAACTSSPPSESRDKSISTRTPYSSAVFERADSMRKCFTSVEPR
jgi:hypothetical protein